MNTRIIKPGFFILSFFFVLALYWPAMKGTPIWDDINFWFKEPSISKNVGYLTILKNYAWPFSVSFQKFLLNMWGTSFIYYHSLSLCLHFVNSYFVYRLGRLLRFKFPMILFLLFLLHPANVISTAWMIQIKTLLCFFFALSSAFLFLKGNKNNLLMILSWILFLLSVTSKSVSLTMPVILAIISWKYYGFKKFHLLIPFFLISSWGTFKVLSSPITLEGSTNATKVLEIKETEPSPEQIIPAKVGAVKEIPPTLETLPEIPQQESPPEIKRTYGLPDLNFQIVLQTMHYYFWQSLIPIQNHPVKGLNYSSPGVADYIHLFFLFIIIFVCWADAMLIYFLFAHLLLIPFSGIILAPFMTITWVSDQHLYLALPFLLAFWLRMVEKINLRYIYVLPIFFIIFFSYKTMQTTPVYKDQITFYEDSLFHNPYNIPIAYNLGFAYLQRGDWKNAYRVFSDTYYQAESEPILKKNMFYPYLERAFMQMRTAMDRN